MNGILVLDKPTGQTSHDCVYAVRRLFGTRKVGHTGTLDPAATGVLVVCLGRATRIIELLTGCDKTYLGEIGFGVETDSYDADGAVVAEADASGVTQPEVAAALDAFRGEFDQIPPMVSAKRVGGQRLHQLARQGKVIERPASRVVIRELALRSFQAGERASAELHVVCGAGTYIRSLAHDLGAVLGCGAHLRSLRRTRVGRFDLRQAATLPELEALDEACREARLWPLALAADDLPAVVVKPEAIEKVRHGVDVYPEECLATVKATGPLALRAPDGRLLAIAERQGEAVHPRKVLAD